MVSCGQVLAIFSGGRPWHQFTVAWQGPKVNIQGALSPHMAWVFRVKRRFCRRRKKSWCINSVGLFSTQCLSLQISTTMCYFVMAIWHRGPYPVWCRGAGSVAAALYVWPPPMLSQGSSSAADPPWADWWPHPSAVQTQNSAEQGSSPGPAPRKSAWPSCSPLVCPQGGVPACESVGRKNGIKKLQCEGEKKKVRYVVNISK